MSELINESPRELAAQGTDSRSEVGAGFEHMLRGVHLPFHPELTIPPLVRVTIPSPTDTVINDARAAASAAVRTRFAQLVDPGMTVAVGAGSRGLTQRVETLAGVIEGLRALGAEPFIVPAMGSHGGGTADGQREVLTGYGITEASTGAEIRSSMRTVEVARTRDGMPMFLDEHAAAADRILPVNRIKPHTCFEGPVESGLTKMVVVGFGKQQGAAQIHSSGPDRMRSLLLDGIVALRNSGRLLGGVGTVENGAGDVVRVEALTPPEMGTGPEQELTDLARTFVPHLPFDQIDVLIVEQVGKDISGVGLDPNVTGRYWVNGLEGDRTVSTIVVLGITPDSHGNALGIGLADFTTAEVAAQIDWQKTYVNCFTAGPAGVRRSRLPMVLPTAADAIKAALSMCGKPVDAPKNVVRIRSTLHLTDMWVSGPLVSEASAKGGLVRSELEPPPF
jgi:hypothetical protein